MLILQLQTEDLPPKSSIYNALAFGVEGLQILEKGTKFTAHQSWPFIVEAINVAKNNTTAPYWFLIRLTDDLGQLKSCLKKAIKYGNSSLKKNIIIVLGGIEAIEQEKYIESNSIFIQQIISDTEMFNNNLDKLESVYRKNGLNGLTPDYENDLNDFFSEDISVIDILTKIQQDENLNITCKKCWVAKLTSLMPEKEDFPILANILDNSEFQNAHTNIRKVFRARDFADHGPKIKSA